MKRLYLIFLIASMILTACKGKYNESTISPSLDLRKGITICEAPKEAIDKVYIVDSTICILYDRSMNDYALRLIPMKQASRSIDLFPYGSGKDSVLMISLSISASLILIKDFVQKKYAILNINQLLGDTLFTIDMIPLTIKTQEMIPINNGNIIYLNQGSFRSNEKRFYTISPAQRPRKVSRNAKKSMNVLDGFFLYEPDMDKLAFLSMYTPEFELYSFSNQKLLHKSIIERDDDFNIIEVNDGKTNQYLFVDRVPFCFMASTSDNERIAAVYRDGQGHSQILCFDWDGNLIDGFVAAGDVYAVSLEHDNLYCWERDEDNDRLVMYDMHNTQ